VSLDSGACLLDTGRGLPDCFPVFDYPLTPPDILKRKFMPEGNRLQENYVYRAIRYFNVDVIAAFQRSHRRDHIIILM